jgi:probable rRNA maturation factor
MKPLYLPPWRIDITVRRGTPRIVPATRLARAIGRALEAAGSPAPASVGLILTDDAELATLNRTHLGETGPTDVLSFPLLPPDAFPARGPSAARGDNNGFVLPPGRRPHIGDIVVSVERAIHQADTGRGGQTGNIAWSPADELRLLVTHGALHLCGWDHAHAEEEAAMRRLERQLLGGTP